jgi:hypothetical protein
MNKRQSSFSYLLAASILLTSIAAWGLYPICSSPVPAASFTAAVRYNQALLKVERDSLHLLDSAYNLIKAYKPDTKADFVETDIKNSIAATKRVWKQDSVSNHRILRIFDIAAKFYQMIYDDKKILQARNASNEALNDSVETYQTPPKQPKQQVANRP